MDILPLRLRAKHFSRITSGVAARSSTFIQRFHSAAIVQSGSSIQLLTAVQIAIYKVEPYVIPADVYAVYPHGGRGGWTWYTGSAGWYYRLVIESLLGVVRVGDELSINPCIPAEWQHYEIDYTYKSTLYKIRCQRASDSKEIGTLTVDGHYADTVQLVDDWQEHQVLYDF